MASRGASMKASTASGKRLLALLLVLLLSLTSVVSHAAMETCAPDCTVAQTEMLEANDAECSACAILPVLPASPSMRPESRVKTPDPVIVHQIPSLPKRPPRA